MKKQESVFLFLAEVCFKAQCLTSVVSSVSYVDRLFSLSDANIN